MAGLRVVAVGHAHQVFLVDVRILANQLARDAAVLGQHQEADGVDVEPAGRRQSTQLLAGKAHRRAVLAPAVLRLYQRGGGLVAVLGLAADKAHGLVQQNGHALLLLAARGGGHFDLRIGRDLQAHLGNLAVHANPALGNPVIGFAARAQAQFGHALVEPAGAGGRCTGCGGCGPRGTHRGACGVARGVGRFHRANSRPGAGRPTSAGQSARAGSR